MPSDQVTKVNFLSNFISKELKSHIQQNTWTKEMKIISSNTTYTKSIRNTEIKGDSTWRSVPKNRMRNTPKTTNGFVNNRVTEIFLRFQSALYFPFDHLQYIFLPLPFNPASPQLMTSFKWSFGCLTRHQFEIIFIFFYKKGIGKSSDLCPLFCSYIKHIVDQYWAPIVAIYPLLLVNNQPTYKSMLGVWLGNQTTFH